MSASDLPDRATLRRLLDYSPETGLLIWRQRGVAKFDTQFAGKAALASRNDSGYLVGHLLSSKVRSHRIIWKWMTGEEPDIIDHINGIRDDNRWCNLRSVTHRENRLNSRLNRRNQHGHLGIRPVAGASTWQARICVNAQDVHLGCFATKELAIRARKAAERRFGFHQNHGAAQ